MFMADVAEELAHTAPGADTEQIAEAAALLRIGGTLELRGGRGAARIAITVDTTSGAVARRLRAAMRRLGTEPPDIEVHAPHEIQHLTRYRIRLEDAARVLATTGLTDAEGRPQAAPPARLTDTVATASAYLRGALMAGGSLSDPKRRAHLEIRAGSEPSAQHLAGVLQDCGAPGARAAPRRTQWRVAVKSGGEIGAVLASAGAHQSYLRWDEGRLRRELRGAANRAVNADRANVARSVSASGQQIEAIHRVIASVGLEHLPDDLTAVALARLANPEASLGQLGTLLDPPVGKATVHRRLARLLQFEG